VGEKEDIGPVTQTKRYPKDRTLVDGPFREKSGTDRTGNLNCRRVLL
jgi:hypothetical protein